MRVRIRGVGSRCKPAPRVFEEKPGSLRKVRAFCAFRRRDSAFCGAIFRQKRRNGAFCGAMWSLCLIQLSKNADWIAAAIRGEKGRDSLFRKKDAESLANSEIP